MASASRTRRVLGVLASVLVVTGLLSACMSPPPAPPHLPVDVTTTFPPRPPAPPATAEGYPRLGGAAPGSLISADVFDTIDPNIAATGATAWRIRYLSMSAVTGAPVEVTGVVIVPGGQAPSDGWRMIAYNHPNTGVIPGCGPSAYEDLANQWGPVTALLQYGFAVVMTDYEGLGGPGRHAFLDSAALGRNVIDAVSAARSLRPDIGARWVTVGTGLGGLAAWAANEQAGSSGAGTQLVGAVARMPWTNLSGLPARAGQRTLTPGQLAVYFQAVMAMQATRGVDVGRFLRGPMYDNRDQLLTCKGAPSSEAMTGSVEADSADAVPADPDAEREMTDLLAASAVPQQRTAAPMLVVYASTDPVIDQDAVEDAINRGCALGDTIEWYQRTSSADEDLDMITTLLWARGRFDGKAPVDLCAPAARQP
jgi:alpha-beta hydrolase superfamily lysophospholipase